MVCTASWAQQFETCPYGWALPGEITWPDDVRAARSNVTLHLRDPRYVATLSVLFSYVPYLIGSWSVLVFLARRGTRELHLLLFQVATTVLTNLLLKPLIGQPRPEQSCLRSCGMPSSHAAVAMGFLTLMLAEFGRRYRSWKAWGAWEHAASNCSEELRSLIIEVFSWPPPSSWDAISGARLGTSVLTWCIVLVPVPLARVLVSDHTVSQVFVGSGVGIALAAIWSTAVWQLQAQHNHRLGEILIGQKGRVLLRHNAALPYPEAERRCAGLDHALLEEPARGWPCCGSRGQVQLRSREPVRELGWYLEQTTRRYAIGCLSSGERARMEELMSRLGLQLDRAEGASRGLPSQGLLDPTGPSPVPSFRSIPGMLSSLSVASGNTWRGSRQRSAIITGGPSMENLTVAPLQEVHESPSLGASSIGGSTLAEPFVSEPGLPGTELTKSSECLS